jgi:hypothetical protein
VQFGAEAVNYMSGHLSFAVSVEPLNSQLNASIKKMTECNSVDIIIRLSLFSDMVFLLTYEPKGLGQGVLPLHLDFKVKAVLKVSESYESLLVSYYPLIFRVLLYQVDVRISKESVQKADSEKLVIQFGYDVWRSVYVNASD